MNVLGDGTFVGIWQGDEGWEEEVLRWARECPAAKHLIFDEGRDDYIPLGLRRAGG